MEFSNDHVMWLAICLDNYTIGELSALQVIFFAASFLYVVPSLFLSEIGPLIKL